MNPEYTSNLYNLKTRRLKQEIFHHSTIQDRYFR